MSSQEPPARCAPNGIAGRGGERGGGVREQALCSEGYNGSILPRGVRVSHALIRREGMAEGEGGSAECVGCLAF